MATLLFLLLCLCTPIWSIAEGTPPPPSPNPADAKPSPKLEGFAPDDTTHLGGDRSTGEPTAGEPIAQQSRTVQQATEELTTLVSAIVRAVQEAAEEAVQEAAKVSKPKPVVIAHRVEETCVPEDTVAQLIKNHPNCASLLTEASKAKLQETCSDPNCSSLLSTESNTKLRESCSAFVPVATQRYLALITERMNALLRLEAKINVLSGMNTTALWNATITDLKAAAKTDPITYCTMIGLLPFPVKYDGQEVLERTSAPPSFALLPQMYNHSGNYSATKMGQRSWRLCGRFSQKLITSCNETSLTRLIAKPLVPLNGSEEESSKYETARHVLEQVISMDLNCTHPLTLQAQNCIVTENAHTAVLEVLEMTKAGSERLSKRIMEQKLEGGMVELNLTVIEEQATMLGEQVSMLQSFLQAGDIFWKDFFFLNYLKSSVGDPVAYCQKVGLFRLPSYPAPVESFLLAYREFAALPYMSMSKSKSKSNPNNLMDLTDLTDLTELGLVSWRRCSNVKMLKLITKLELAAVLVDDVPM